MRNNQEYQLYKAVAMYLRLQYPHVLYHYDPTGLDLSKTQSGMLKAIQGGKGFPDLMIYKPNGRYHGLFIELKKEGTNIYKKSGAPATPHIAEQVECLMDLRSHGYKALFAVGFEQAKQIIDDYLNPDNE